MRLTDIEADLGRRLGFDPTTDTVAVARIRAYINETHREILRRKHFRRFRRRPLTTASVANNPYLVIPQAAVRVFGVRDTTNDKWLTEKDLAWIRQVDPALRATAANPWAIAPYDDASAVAVQPANASEIFIKSTAAGDTQNAYIEVVRTGGYMAMIGPVALTGTTAKTMSATMNDIVAINKFYLSSAAVGTISLCEDSGAGTVLSVIPIGETYARYKLAHLYPVPSAAVTYSIDAEVRVEDMANPNDEPLIPEEFHGILGIGARKKEYEKREKWDAVGNMDNEFEREIRRMITWVNQQFGSLSQTPQQHSQLGPWFEAGT